eukprot:5874311-Pyramimonas_sp.AAC.1
MDCAGRRSKDYEFDDQNFEPKAYRWIREVQDISDPIGNNHVDPQSDVAENQMHSGRIHRVNRKDRF